MAALTNSQNSSRLLRTLLERVEAFAKGRSWFGYLKAERHGRYVTSRTARSLAANRIRTY